MLTDIKNIQDLIVIKGGNKGKQTLLKAGVYTDSIVDLSSPFSTEHLENLIDYFYKRTNGEIEKGNKSHPGGKLYTEGNKKGLVKYITFNIDENDQITNRPNFNLMSNGTQAKNGLFSTGEITTQLAMAQYLNTAKYDKTFTNYFSYRHAIRWRC